MGKGFDFVHVGCGFAGLAKFADAHMALRFQRRGRASAVGVRRGVDVRRVAVQGGALGISLASTLIERRYRAVLWHRRS